MSIPVEKEMNLQKEESVMYQTHPEKSVCFPPQSEVHFCTCPSNTLVLHEDKEREFSPLEKIALLEKELQEAKENVELEVNKVKIKYEERIKLIQEDLLSSQSDLKYLLRTTQTSLDSKRSELKRILDGQRKTITIVQRLEEEIREIQEKCNQLGEDKMKLELTISSKDKIISDLKMQACNAEIKVAEACDVVRQALMERNGALVRAKNAEDEIIQLMQAFGEIAENSMVTMSQCPCDSSHTNSREE